MDPILILLVVFVVLMFFMSSRQRKAQAKAQDFVNNLTPGTKVMTMSGLVGTVVEVTDEHVTLESVPHGGTTVWVKAAIRQAIVDQVAGDDVDDTATASDTIDEIEIPNDVAKLIGEDTSGIDKYTKSDEDPGRESGTSK